MISKVVKILGPATLVAITGYTNAQAAHFQSQPKHACPPEYYADCIFAPGSNGSNRSGNTQRIVPTLTYTASGSSLGAGDVSASNATAVGIGEIISNQS